MLENRKEEVTAQPRACSQAGSFLFGPRTAFPNPVYTAAEGTLSSALLGEEGLPHYFRGPQLWLQVEGLCTAASYHYLRTELSLFLLLPICFLSFLDQRSRHSGSGSDATQVLGIS